MFVLNIAGASCTQPDNVLLFKFEQMKTLITKLGISLLWSLMLLNLPGSVLMAQSESIIKDTIPAVDFDSLSNVYIRVEKMPVFPGGDYGLYSFLAKKLKYPALAREENIEGLVLVEFLIDKSGKIHDPKVKKGIGGGCDEEALRVVKLMPDWIPGYQNGEVVTVRYTLYVRFRLS